MMIMMRWYRYLHPRPDAWNTCWYNEPETRCCWC